MRERKHAVQSVGHFLQQGDQKRPTEVRSGNSWYRQPEMKSPAAGHSRLPVATDSTDSPLYSPSLPPLPLLSLPLCPGLSSLSQPLAREAKPFRKQTTCTYLSGISPLFTRSVKNSDSVDFTWENHQNDGVDSFFFFCSWSWCTAILYNFISKTKTYVRLHNNWY